MIELRCPRCYRLTFYSPEHGRRICQCGCPFVELDAIVEAHKQELENRK